MWASLFRLDGSHLVSIGQMNSATNDCEIKGGRGTATSQGPVWLIILPSQVTPLYMLHIHWIYDIL